MSTKRLLHPTSVFSAFSAASLLIGSRIPQIYDWTGSDQSRPSPWVPAIAISMLIVGLMVCIALPWLPFPNDEKLEKDSRRFQFGMRNIVFLTTLVAVQIGLLRSTPMLVPAVGSLLLAIGCTVYWWIYRPTIRWRLLSLFACLYFPFVWILFPPTISQLQSEQMWLFLGLPGFLPALIIGSWFTQGPRLLDGAGMLFVAWELIIGVWLVSQGPRRAIAFTILVLILSVFGSFVLNALMRA